MKSIIIRKTITLLIISCIFSTIYYFMLFRENLTFLYHFTHTFFFFTMFYLMIAWFFYLRIDGFNFFNSGIAERIFTHKNNKQVNETEKRLKLPSGLNYYANPKDSDFLDSTLKEKAHMYSYIIAAIICLVISFF